MTKVGLALGGGGAKGLAHIPVLEALDDMGVPVAAIAGTSIGAILGALYASGRSGADIRAEVDELSGARARSNNSEHGPISWLAYLQIEFDSGGMLRADRFLSSLIQYIGVDRFADLPIPLATVAADFWRRDEVVFTDGPLEPAIRASMALPGIFRPVVDGDRVLIDGGAVNPVPYDRLPVDCDLVVAVDVMGERRPNGDPVPGLLDSVFNTYQIMQRSILRQKMAQDPPGILVQPPLVDIRVLEFWKSEEIFRQAEPATAQFKRDLEATMGGLAAQH